MTWLFMRSRVAFVVQISDATNLPADSLSLRFPPATIGGGRSGNASDDTTLSAAGVRFVGDGCGT